VTADRAAHRPPPFVTERLEAFARAGFDDDDAVLLSRLWSLAGSGPARQAKIVGGDKLLNGGTLPIEHGRTASEVSRDAADEAYLANGYDYDDAVTLARLWQKEDIGEVKALAGQQVLDGLRLPGVPYHAPQNASAVQLLAFFESGYTYEDAVRLARRWGHGRTPYDVKVRVGDLILAGRPVPRAG